METPSLAPATRETRDTVKLLMEELINFSHEAKFAVEQENWSYLQEILKKKEGHLALLHALTNAGNIHEWGLEELAHALQAAETAACAAIENKLAEARQKQAELDAMKNRTQHVKKLVKMQKEEDTAWKATA